MTDTLMRQARGRWQREICRDLVRWGEVPNPVANLRGNARNYSGRYMGSFLTLIGRIRAAGIGVERIPGPKGGEYSAVYRLK